MKVGILSINMYTPALNYGAVLHSWAFQQVLNDLGIENEIIDYKLNPYVEDINLKYPVFSKGKKKFKTRVGWLTNMIAQSKRYNKFQNFFDKNYVKSKTTYTEKNVNQLNYDAYICESDVIWSPEKTGGLDDIYFCNYPVMKNKLKIAYAASMGDIIFNEDDRVFFSQRINNFDFISVREYEAKNFAENHTTKNIEVVLDPVLLLNSNRFQDIVKPPNLKKKYLLVYIVGASDGLQKSAAMIARKNGWEVIEISNRIWNIFRNKLRNSAGIEEYLGYFQNAEAVMTNTFHGTVFSILYKKDFYVYSVFDKNIKISNLLKITDLGERMIKQGSFITSIKSINYDDVYNKIENYREKSMCFIKKSLNVHNVVK